MRKEKDDGIPTSAIMADVIISASIPLVFWREDWYAYNGKFWQMIEKQKILSMIDAYISESWGRQYATAKYVDQTYGVMQNRCYLDSHKEAPTWIV